MFSIPVLLHLPLFQVACFNNPKRFLMNSFILLTKLNLNRHSGRACRVDGQVELEEKEEVQAALQTDWRSTETRQIPRDEDDQEEEEELSFTPEEKEDLRLRREERHMEKGEEEEEEEEFKMSEKVDFPTTAASTAAVMSICIFCHSLR